MAIKSMFFNAIKEGDAYDRTYNADDFSRYLENIVGNGVFPNPSTSLQAAASSGMDIVVKQGSAWIAGHKLINTAALTLTVDASESLLNRIDRVVCYIDYVNRVMDIEIVKGTPATNPTAPALVRTDSRYELSLATIYVAKQVTAITNANITDTRADTTICGWTTGVLQQVDTSTLFQQWQTAYSDYYADVKQQLDDFMETLTQELGVNTYLKSYDLHREIDAGTQSFTVVFNPIGYDGYDPTDVISVFINGLKGSLANGDYTLNTGGGALAIEFSFQEPSDLPTLIDINVLKTIIGINQ